MLAGVFALVTLRIEAMRDKTAKEALNADICRRQTTMRRVESDKTF